LHQRFTARHVREVLRYGHQPSPLERPKIVLHVTKQSRLRRISKRGRCTITTRCRGDANLLFWEGQFRHGQFSLISRVEFCR
jgi:hypothetical protein